MGMNAAQLTYMRYLCDKLNDATEAYDKGEPIMSDKDWDDLYFELEGLENLYDFRLENSPTQKINYQVVNRLTKVEHNHPMLSLDKTKSINDVVNFFGYKNGIAMCKMDGLTCSIRYVDGKLVSAETRGNGVIGEDVLHNARHVKGIPLTISFKEDIIIDGEIICTYKDFKDYEKDYKNPRNFASGSIRLLDSAESAKRKLTFVTWDVIKGLDNLKTLSDKLRYLSTSISNEFKIVPWLPVEAKEESIEEAIDSCKQMAHFMSYPIDGVVFKINDCADYDAQGRTDHHFKGGIAYKFYDEIYTSTLKDIEWTMGRTGILTPVAVFEPIDMDGTIVERASLHNLSIMEKLIPCPSTATEVDVFKANMIIPQIAASRNDYKSFATDIRIPFNCPICGKALIRQENNGVKNLYCPNPDCEGKFLNKLDHFCGKKGLDIKGISKATLEKLMDWGWVTCFADIFELELYRQEWSNKSGFGDASVFKILTAIREASTTTLDKFIAAIGIPLIGNVQAKEIVKYFHTWEDFREAINTKFDFSKFYGFGESKMDALLHFNYTEADKVYNYLDIIYIPEVEINQTLENINVCITGSLKIFKNRDELTAAIAAHGGKVVSGVTKKTNYLITNDTTSGSAKNVAAKKYDIPILSEAEFQEKFLKNS